MKKLLLLFACFVIFSHAQAQISIVYYEDFSNGMPSNYNIVDLDGLTPSPQLNWPANTAWQALNGAAYSISWYTTVVASNDWMITGAIDIPALTAAENSYLLTWYGQALDPQYPDGYEVYVGTVGNAPTDFSDKVFTIASEVSGGRYRAVDISAYAGQTVYVAFRNNSLDKFILLIDDIQISEVGPNDIGAIRTTNKGYNTKGNIKPSVEVINLGGKPITSFVLNYSIDGGPTVSHQYTNQNIPLLGQQIYNHPTNWDATEGLHTVEMWITDVNAGEDADMSNNDIAVNVSVFDPANTTQRRAIVENFSASTCAPCAPANTAFHNLLNGIPAANRPITMKFQMPFPGVGDPYTTDEIAFRGMEYYSAGTGIPASWIDGDFWNGNTSNITTTILNNAKNRPGLTTIEATYTLDTVNQTIGIKGKIIPSAHLIEGTKLMIAIKEKETTKNAKTNGETKFFNVVKKLINGLEGIDVSFITPGEEYTFDVEYQFQGNYRLPVDGQPSNRINHLTEHSVEYFSNLAASVWVEYPRDRYILNAADAEFTTVGIQEPTALNTFKVFPNPANAEATIQIGLDKAIDCQIQVYDVAGRLVMQPFNGTMNEGQFQTLISVSSLASGTYFVHFRSAQGISVRTIDVVRP